MKAKFERAKRIKMRSADLSGAARGRPTVMKRKTIERKSIRNVIRYFVIILAASQRIWAPSERNLVEGLQITGFRVPAFVPNSLPTAGADLAKPILFDCDYDYKPDEDERLTVKWFKNKEAEPFYQWLPELGVRHFADWIRPLVNQSFVSDPHDPLKRYRSLLVRRLSMNLTGQYTCLVSSLAGQDMRQASLVVYQPPRTFTFEHRIFPAPTVLAAPAPASAVWPQRPGLPRTTPPQSALGAPADMLPQPFINPTSGSSPTQFRGLAPPPLGRSHWQQQQTVITNHHQQSGSIIRPPNNNNNNSQTYHHLSSLQQQQLAPPGADQANSSSTRIVYTHDGRPIRRKSKRQSADSSGQPPLANWQLRRRLSGQPAEALHTIQLHHFQCQATQVTPRPVLVLTVKRDLDSIAQYLHESSSLVVRPYQASQAELLAGRNGSSSSSAADPSDMLVTLYDIQVSATIALNVSLPASGELAAARPGPADESLGGEPALGRPAATPAINTVLQYRRGQRMSFECHLELTGTEFEQRKRIQISEEEVYKFAEAEEARKRRLHGQQEQIVQQFQWRQHQANGIKPTGGPDEPSGLGHADQENLSNGLLSLVGLAPSSAAPAPLSLSIASLGLSLAASICARRLVSAALGGDL